MRPENNNFAANSIVMNKTVVYTLSECGSFGCFPECCIVDTDENGKFLSHYITINANQE